MTWLCGVDGFKDRWRAVLGDFSAGEYRFYDTSFEEILNLSEMPAVITIDVPIGLPEVTLSGGRICDRRAREMLSPMRHGSVFSPVGRSALRLASRLEAHQQSLGLGGIGIGAQSWGLRNKLLEVDDVMTPVLQRRVFEVHPEVSFYAMNGGQPAVYSKKTSEGREERTDALKAAGFPETFLTPLQTLRSGRDDYLDACAALWTAQRIFRGAALRIPLEGLKQLDVRGLDMAIWY